MADQQNYANHRKFDPVLHYVAMPLLLLGAIAAIANLYIAIHWFRGYRGVIGASALALVSLGTIIIAVKSRLYALKVQDRVIALEVSERYERLAGKPFVTYGDKLTAKQIVALRFASDAELVTLIGEAAEKNMKPAEIKQSIKQWRADNRRI